MKPRSFVYLAGAAAVSALLAIVSFVSNNQWSTVRTTGEKLLPGLSESVGDIAELEVRQGENVVVLQRKDGKWAVESREGFPAVDAAKVRTLLVTLGQAQLVEGKTRKPERYAALELEDPTGKTAKSRLLKLTGAKGNTIAEVVIGKQRPAGYGAEGGNHTYVRKVGDPQTWLANVGLSASAAVKDWVKTSVLSLEADKIDRIAVEIPGEEALKIERPAPVPAAKDKTAEATKDAKAGEATKDAKAGEATKDAKAGEAAKDAKAAEATKGAKAAEPPAPPPAKLAFVGFPPEGKKLKDADAAEMLARAAGSIDLEDVRKLAEAPAGEGIGVVRIEMKDGPTAILRLRKDGDAHWLSVTASGEGEAARKAADEIAARTEGWEFKIPAGKANAILKKRADLLEAPQS
jgi:hypothetical protein